MRQNFEYFYSREAIGNLDVEDIGNCSIEANDDLGNFYYIVIDTNLGFTRIFEYGPCNPDFNELPKAVGCTFNRIEFNEKQIQKRIYSFLNAPHRNITQAQLVDRDYALDGCKDIIEYMRDPFNF
jgi:hypothetical protein